MDTAIIETLARIAGIGGVAVGVLLILFREVLRRTVFSRISPDHSFRLLRLVVVLTGAVAVGGLATWAVTARQSASAAKLAQVRAPIDALFQAWETRDLDAYLAQWHPRGRQWIGRTPRTLAEIGARRRADFVRYRDVHVIDYRVDVEDAATEPVTARVTYSMRFLRPDGTWISETDMRETYKLVRLDRRWVIMENFDYFAK